MLRTLRPCLWWIFLTLVALSAPHGLAAQQPAAVPANDVSSRALPPSALPNTNTYAGSLDQCVIQIHKVPADVTGFGRGVHPFHAEDEGIAPRLHRRAGMEATSVLPGHLPVSIAFQFRVVPRGESSAKCRPVGRAPPAV